MTLADPGILSNLVNHVKIDPDQQTLQVCPENRKTRGNTPIKRAGGDSQGSGS